jgi:hypothetical protein
MKKSEVLIITEENNVLVFHTKNFDIFERPLKESQVEMECEEFIDSLEVRLISGAPKKNMLRGATEEELALLTQSKYLSYADTFLYEYPSNEIYFLTQSKFGVYVYCNWRLIADLLKV